MADGSYPQHPYRCRLAWGPRGSGQAAARGDVVVVVDTLSFSSAAVVAAHRGAMIYPCDEQEDPAAVAAMLGAEPAVPRRDVPAKGRFSLSPHTFLAASPGQRVVVRSINGGLCLRRTQQAPAALVGCLLNAEAAAFAAAEAADQAGRCVSVIACGERYVDGEPGELRPAVEDYIGAGAIICLLRHRGLRLSPEATVCEGAFLHARPRLKDVLRDCESGQELCQMGFQEDVILSGQLDLYDSVPVLREGWLERLG